MHHLDGLRHAVNTAPLIRVTGRLVQAVGPLLEAELPGVMVGACVTIEPGVLAEVVGFRNRRALLMPLASTDGIAFGAKVASRDDAITVNVGEGLLGRVLDGLGRPMDEGPPIPPTHRRRISADAPAAMRRALISRPIATGVRVIDGMLTLGRGQRISIMAGSGVGKSTLLGMLARNMQADVNVVCLIGERGREVREFIEHSLGPEGMARSVVVVVTSEQSPALQVKGAFLATTLAEYFRDQGKDVLLMMDSITRLALAQRQIGLAAGEPPTTRGFTPSVFALMPRLLERAGAGADGGSITGIYTVLIEGDDVHDPVGDAVRGIVDGHIVLSRKLASHGHYPAVDVLASLSRLMDRVVTPNHRKAASRTRDLMATWEENEELIRLGAYRKGSSAAVDEALEKLPRIKEFLKQPHTVGVPMEETVKLLERACGMS